MMQELTRIALAGISRHTTSSDSSNHPAEALVGQLASENREHVFLLRVGSRAVFEQCGQVARTNLPAQTPCPAEVLPWASSGVVGVLQNALASSSWDLLCEFLRELSAAKLLLPPELLPQALSISEVSVRELLLPVLGERGQWLSRFNAGWDWVTAGTGTLSENDREQLSRQWDEGTIGERCRALLSVRQSDPAEARRWLETAFEKEKADHRLRLLATFEDSVSDADEPLLESLLDDRSEPVRALSARMLARLANSRLSERMRQRAAGLLTGETSGFLRKTLKLDCRPPEEIDKSWERDGIPRKVPAGRGKRAVWTEGVLSLVPPSYWSGRFGCDPGKLIAAIEGHDFAEAVLVGWTHAAVHFGGSDDESAVWLGPLWNHWVGVESRTRGAKTPRVVLEFLQALLQVMPEPEGPLLQVLKQTDASDASELLGLVAILPRPWSQAFALEYLALVRKVLKTRSDNSAYQWANTLFAMGRALPRTAFARALEPWDIDDSQSAKWYVQSIEREVEKLRDTIETRRSFYNSVQQL